MKIVKELVEEMKSVITGKTLDAVLPPLLFVVVNGLAGLNIAVIVSLIFAVALGVTRLLRKQAWLYAFGGFIGVAFASGFAYLTTNAANFFIPTIISSAFLFLIALLSLFLGKPLAAWGSHLTRGWPLEWFWRKDVKPAYQEVTWFWAAFFLIRLIVHVVLLQGGDAVRLAWVNALLGWPVIIFVLTVSYIYGIWRLRNLGGPGVEEFQAGKKAPWQGQVRGF